MRLIVADDSMLFREGLARLLGDAGFDVVAQTASAEDLLRRVGGLQPDVAIVDIRMPPTFSDEGLVAARELGERHPDVGVLVLSQYIESSFAMRLLEEGSAGRGYLLKDRVDDLDAFAAAIRRVGNGGSVVDPEVIAALVDRSREPGPLDELTEREHEILKMMAEGRSNSGICERLTLSPRTIESHVRTIFIKLGLSPTDDDNRRVLAVLAYLRG
ncbi:MAG TPA: response regulator transcription factor [Solirubrobacteraceae bacterium]